MKNETKNCQNCKKDFIIESEDFSFYEKIKVPPPTWCPECRLQRRMAWRNEWHMFRRKDARTGEIIFSLFPAESPYKVYERDFWWSDGWDPTQYAKDFDFSKPFFAQFKELLLEVPIPSHSMINVVNSQYCGNAANIKNCYFARGVTYTEDSSYLIWDQGSKSCLDSHMTSKCELSYGNVNTINCYKTFFSVDCESCQEVILSKDCVGCNNCIASTGLRNKSYCIFNQEYGKQEYLKKLSEFNLGSHDKFQELKTRAYQHWLKYPQKFMRGRQNVQVSGDYIYESKNALNCFRVRGLEDCKFSQNILSGPVKDCYDFSNWGNNAELVYESMIIGGGASNIKFCLQSYMNVRNLTYCVFCHDSSDLFGCVSLRNKQYCIFNKQYTKEEYEKLVPKIIEYMKETKEYGEFFPANFSFFPYQVTQAYEFFPLSEQELKNKGFLWYEIPKQNYKITLSNYKIPDNVKEATEDILNEVIECEHKENCEQECTGAFRMIKSELEFLKRMNIPLPRLCPNCRHYERLLLRNSPRLYKSKCACDGSTSSPQVKKHSNHQSKCEVEFETSYAPDRPEIVYCEKCYQQEVY